MSVKVAINGFGRIGRLTLRRLFDLKEKDGKAIDIVAVNDLGNIKTLAYLLSHDSAQGKWNVNDIKTDIDNGFIIVKGQKIKFLSEKEPSSLPWKELNVDIVIESTGRFTAKDKAEVHLQAGAKKVLISAPATGDLKTIVYNINHEILTAEDKIISGASCTTNCLAPLVHTLQEKFGIKSGLMTTVHAITNDQRLLDLEHPDPRRGRAANYNIIPAGTGAAAAIGLVIPDVAGKLDGFALRVPVITGSIVDLTVKLEKEVTVAQVNDAMKAAANESFGYDDQLVVSSDIIGSNYGSIFDPTITKVIGKGDEQIVKALAWYDNEMSYVSQLVRTLIYFAQL